MKRFLILALCALAAVVGGYFAVYQLGFYLPGLEAEEVDVPFRAQEKTLQVRRDGDYTPLTIRGVEVLAGVPGSYNTDFAATEEDYLRWLEEIGAMGANTVELVTTMDDEFYNALYAYNTTHDEPLYLLQGMMPADDVNAAPGSAYDTGLMDSLIRIGKHQVDVIHGRKDVLYAGLEGSGRYRKDVSPWAAGFVVGVSWDPDTIAYTDHASTHAGRYQGTYFETGAEATPFEAMLARVMDEITAYETEKYGAQRPIAFSCDPSCCFLQFEDIYARQMSKYAAMDPEHIKATDRMAAGTFAAYRLEDLYPNFPAYLDSAQKTELASLLAKVDSGRPFSGLTGLLADYHTVPLLATGYSSSTTRNAVTIGVAPKNETDQGEYLAEISRVLEADGWAGGIVSSWQDSWTRRSWNTAFAIGADSLRLWHDLQSNSQNNGLMAFVSGETPVCLLDGNPEEWTEKDRVFETENGLALSARYDREGLYLLVEGLLADEKADIPIDISPEVGSAACEDPALTFQREADFLLRLNGPEDSRLLVQERFDAMREQFHNEITGQNAYTRVPDMDSPRFVPVRSALENNTLLDEITPETVELRRLGTWETGKLTHGTGNPDDPAYDSLADFCYGDGCVEIRLPWLLLNVGDPADMTVHGDYYTHYGVKEIPIRSIALGAARAGETGEIPMADFSVRGLGRNVTARERLKKSYTILQEQWRGGEDDAVSG